MKTPILPAFFGAVAILCSCGGDESTSSATSGEGAPAKVSIVLNWFPEMEHGGFYGAQAEGLFAREGLDVTIVPGGVDVPVIALVATGRNTFGVTNADDVILGRAQGADLIALMAPMQDSPRVIMVHANSGINGLADLKDMTLAMGIGAGFGEFVRKKFPLTNVTIVPYPGSISVFLENKNFAQQAYSISEPFVARKNGGNPKNIFVSEYGYNPYTSVLVVSRDYLETNRDVVRRTVKASIEGWELYMKDPAKTNVLINQQNPQMDLESLSFGVGEMQPLVFTEATKTKGMGTMDPARWSDMVETMVEVELIRAGAVDPKDCYTLEFLPKSE